MKSYSVLVRRTEDGQEIEETVDGVVVARPLINSISDAEVPEGAISCLDLAFPKTYDKSLRGATVEFAGRVYSVAGNPIHTPGAPSKWDMYCRAYEIVTSYSERILFQERVVARDANHRVQTTWSDRFELDCTVLEQAGGETSVAGGVRGYKTLVFTTPWDDELAPLVTDPTGWRVCWSGAFYDISNVNDVGANHTSAKITANLREEVSNE